MTFAKTGTTVTWVVVADQARTRIYARGPDGVGLALVKDVLNPEGRQKNRDMDTDRPGRSFDSMGTGRHSMEREQGAIAHITERFAKEIGELLEKGRQENAFARLALIASPRFLGLLRGTLTKETTALVSNSVAKDLAHADEREVAAFINEFLVGT